MYPNGRFNPHPYQLDSMMPTLLAWGILGLGLLGGTAAQNCSWGGATCAAQAAPTLAQSHALITVNSNQDEIKADEGLTLREAIAFTNGTLQITDLSAQEQSQVQYLNNQTHSRIEFQLSPNQTTIRLRQPLPTIMHPGLTLDGMSWKSSTESPGIAITPDRVGLDQTPADQVHRGFTVAADHVTIQGFHLYGFQRQDKQTHLFPSADIIITTRDAPFLSAEYRSKFGSAPTGVKVQNNWLGGHPNQAQNELGSDFGIWLYNSQKAQILNNTISYHRGSAINSSVQATDTLISENEIHHNGLAGIVNAIHLEGNIEGTQLIRNQITNNGGSGLYLFRSQGAIQAEGNQIANNGIKRDQAAVYLMGNDHQVLNNQIQNQPGPGIVVAAYPESNRNLILNNRFAQLKGLSIDLVYRRHTGVKDYILGDGANPPRNSKLRRKDGANRAINAPQFLSSEFYLFNGKAGLDGIADPGSIITLYSVQAEKNPAERIVRGVLSTPVAETTANEEGKFAFDLEQVTSGDCFSAIATHPDYGTSEPALNVVVRSY